MSTNRIAAFFLSRRKTRLEGKRTLAARSCSGLFWCNNDDDWYLRGGDAGDHAPVQEPDCENHTIDGVRDLEDFSRLQMYIGGLHEAIVNGQIKVGLKWKNTGTTHPSINLFNSADNQGTDGYLNSETAARAQLEDGHSVRLIEVKDTQAVVLPDTFWQESGLSATKPVAYFLFEGCTEGKGQLVITIHDSTGKEIGEGPGVWLDLVNVRTMYQRGKAVMPGGSEDVPSPFDLGDTQPPDPGMVNVANPDGHYFTQPSNEAQQTIVFVHGWRMEYSEAMSWGDTMFKRLWHRGYKGRFATFRWPTFTGSPVLAKYNESEYRAWKSGRALKQFVDGLPYANAKNICAHSMGNIVVGSAIKQGMKINNYILMQAAVPSGAYNVNQANFQPFVDKDATDPTPDGASDLGYREFLGGLSGNLVNFYNDRDEALRAWNINNAGDGILPAFKPNRFITATQSYGYNPAYALGQRSTLVGLTTARLALDPHESMSFVSRSRTITVGRELTSGSVSGNHNLDSTYNFGGEHSAQWTWAIQKLKPFYDRMLEEYDITTSP